MTMIRKNKNNWIILLSVIVLAILLYYFFFRDRISPFQTVTLCPLSSIQDILKHKSGLFTELTSFPTTCPSLSSGDFYTVSASETPLYNTYMNLLSETYIINKFLNTGRDSSGSYVLAINPVTPQLSISEALANYYNSIITGLIAIKARIGTSDTALAGTVNGILSTFGPESKVIADYGTIKDYIEKYIFTYSALGYTSILKANYTPERIATETLKFFKSFTVSPGCSDTLTVNDISTNYDNILDFTYVLKLLYGIVKDYYITNQIPNLTFAKLSASPAYSVIKTYYLNPMNAFTGYNRNSYTTDDLYMQAIVQSIDSVISKSIASDGKIKTTTDMSLDILYTKVKVFNDKCTSLAGNANCYTDSVKIMCNKLDYIIKYTGSIENIDVVGYTLPTVPMPTTTAGPTTTPGATTTGPTTTAGPTTPVTTGPTTTAGPTTPVTTGPTTTAGPTTPRVTTPGATSPVTTPGTTKPTSLIFDLANQIEYQKFLDDLSVLFTGRTGDPDEIINTLLNLNQEQRNSICSTYCNGLYAECTDICRLAKCENCTGGIDNSLTGAGKPGTGSGYSNYTASYNLLDNITDNQLGLNTGGQGGTSSHVGPMLYQKDGDGINNIFAPYVLVQPNSADSGSGYSAFLLNNPNDPLYKAYLSQLIADYNATQ